MTATIEQQIARLTQAVADLSKHLAPWITTAEMCARYDCTPKTLNAMERRGDIPWRDRGHVVAGDITKIFRRSING